MIEQKLREEFDAWLIVGGIDISTPNMRRLIDEVFRQTMVVAEQDKHWLEELIKQQHRSCGTAKKHQS
ncbi:MAG TPA: hypothetical protein VGV14_02895 [Rhodanobacter sp.]|nr:hypothetical protein [Rhodanobacter sp.]